MSELPLDRRRLLSVISDIKQGWKGGKREEYAAMEYGIEEFHKWLCDQEKDQGPEDGKFKGTVEGKELHNCANCGVTEDNQEPCNGCYDDTTTYGTYRHWFPREPEQLEDQGPEEKEPQMSYCCNAEIEQLSELPHIWYCSKCGKHLGEGAIEYPMAKDQGPKEKKGGMRCPRKL